MGSCVSKTSVDENQVNNNAGQDGMQRIIVRKQEQPVTAGVARGEGEGEREEGEGVGQSQVVSKRSKALPAASASSVLLIDSHQNLDPHRKGAGSHVTGQQNQKMVSAARLENLADRKLALEHGDDISVPGRVSPSPGDGAEGEHQHLGSGAAFHSFGNNNDGHGAIAPVNDGMANGDIVVAGRPELKTQITLTPAHRRSSIELGERGQSSGLFFGSTEDTTPRLLTSFSSGSHQGSILSGGGGGGGGGGLSSRSALSCDTVFGLARTTTISSVRVRGDIDDVMSQSGSESDSDSDDDAVTLGILRTQTEIGRAVQGAFVTSELTPRPLVQEASLAPLVEKVSRGKTPSGAPKLNEFCVLHTLGRGSFGKVKLAQNINMEEEHLVAIKSVSKVMLKRQVMRLGGSRRKRRPTGKKKRRGSQSGVEYLPPRPEPLNHLQKLQREIDICRLLVDHPRIAKVEQVINDPTHEFCFFVLEICSLGALMEWDGSSMSYKSSAFPVSPAGGLPMRAAGIVFRGLMQAVSHLHNNLKVIHRDIKPDNILLTEDLVSKLSDFSVAQRFGSQIPARHVGKVWDTVGTYHYVSPECVMQDCYDGFAADIWACGITLFVLICGKVPWFSTHHHEIFDMIQNAPLQFPENFPEDAELRDLLQGLLNKDPKKRLSLEQIAVHPWVSRKEFDSLRITL